MATIKLLALGQSIRATAICISTYCHIGRAEARDIMFSDLPTNIPYNFTEEEAIEFMDEMEYLENEVELINSLG